MPATLPEGHRSCRKCKRTLPMDDFAIIKCEQKKVPPMCELCFSKE